MIVTRTWLDEWIDLSDISTDEICKTLNAIGLEVDSVKTVKMPQKCVVGYVKSRKKHPDADKLSVCEVDIGSSIVTIVCGAPNVDKDQWVAVALEGAELPDGLKIKKASLRGVESNGMICSSTELGLPKINDGIMVLDSSLGELKCGKNLSELNGLEDDFIEIGLTPNRGDCLSVRGVARDLSAAFKRPLKEICCLKEEDNLLGIGRILTLHAEEKIKSNLLYHAFEQKNISSSVLMELRLAAVELSYEGDIERLISYATYSTGVLLRAYDYKCFKKKDEKAIIELKKDKRGFDAVFGKDGRASYIGYLQEPSCKVTKDSNTVVIEASFTPTKEISVLGAKNKDLQSDKHFYRSSRGSETDLALGVLYLWKLLENEEEVTIYAGGQKISNEAPPKVVILQMSELLKMIGQEVSKNSVVNILKWLSFDVSIKGEQEILNITVPPFRHDIFAPQDICEEIIRVIGIDNIESKPLKFFEKSRINETLIWHNFKNKIRLKAASVGFFESIHYLFDSKEKQDFYGLKSIKRQKELSNPITVELNTLRTSLLLHLLEAASNNIKNGKRSVALFELGRVFDGNRKETTKLSFIFSGESEFPSVSNHGKPKDINFFDFTTKIKHVIGEIRVESSSPEDKLSNPYEYASVYQDQKKIGYIARVHKLVENRLDLPTTYIAEIEVEKLMKDRILAKAYSKFPTSSRDLSFLVPKDMAYHTIRHALEATKVPNLDKFYPIDKFEDESLGEFMSLTMSFRFQNSEKTLEDSEVDGAIELIQKELKKSLGYCHKMTVLKVDAAKSFNTTIWDIAPDKSISHRAAIFALLSDKSSYIENFLEAEDSLNSLKIVQSLGASVKKESNHLIITPPSKINEPASILDCGNSGTAMRLLIGFLAGVDGFFTIHGDKYLATRPMNRVVDPLREIGANIDGREKGNLSPISIRGSSLNSFNYDSKIASAQVKSAMILAALRANGVSTISEPFKSRDHTEKMLLEMGAKIEIDGLKNIVHPMKKPLKPLEIYIGADPSSAFFFALAAAIVPKSSVTLKKILLNPTRIEAFEVLKKMGANIEYKNISGEHEIVGDIEVNYSKLKAVDLETNIAWLIDEIPALAIAFACASGVSRVKNAKELRVKESDRISATVQNLKKCGISCKEYEDGFEVEGGEFKSAEVDSFGDHRIAMSFAIAGLKCGMKIKDSKCINASFPNFIDILNRLSSAYED